MNKETIVELFDRYVNEHGQWYQFKNWIEEQGYTTTELGFPDED